MASFDWIVVGNGLTGAALAYELVRQGMSVLLLDHSDTPASATRYSYGGIPQWAQKTPLTRRLSRLSRDRYEALPTETGVDIELRELDLLLTVPPGADPVVVGQDYALCDLPPEPLSVAEALALEPHLNPKAIAGGLRVPQAQVNPTALVTAYNHGFQALGGHYTLATVTGLVQVGNRITGVTTPTQAHSAGQVAIAAGGFSRQLLHQRGIPLPLYFSHAEIIETPPLALTLTPLIMPAQLQRIALERQVSHPGAANQWRWKAPALSENPGGNLAPELSPELPGDAIASILDPGLIQFQDRHCRLGQISYIHPDPHHSLDPHTSETQLRQSITHLIPALKDVPGQWRHCTVAFTRDGLPLVGPIPHWEGLVLFSGFSGPFALVPGLAMNLAQWASGNPDVPADTLAAVTPARFL